MNGIGLDGSRQPDLHPAPSARAEIQRRRPKDYTGGLRAAGNAVLSASAFIVLIPILVLQAAGTFGVAQAVGAFVVACIWLLSVVEHASLWKNRELKSASELRLKAEHPELVRSVLGFVGVSTPGFRMRQLLHCDMAHEDVGMLCSTPSSLLFMGDGMQIAIPKHSISQIVLRCNPFYAIAGIRWIEVTYRRNGADSQLYIQSREKQQLSQIGLCNVSLCARLNRWLTANHALSSGDRQAAPAA